MSVKTRLDRLKRVNQASEPVHIGVGIPDGSGGVLYNGKAITMAEWDQIKSKADQVITITPERRAYEQPTG